MLNLLRMSSIVLSLTLSGCSMQNNFSGDLDALLKDVPGFNQKYGAASLLVGGAKWPSYEVKGLNLKGARFEHVNFTGSKISKSRFTDCVFENSSLVESDIAETEFINCRFEKCAL